MSDWKRRRKQNIFQFDKYRETGLAAPVYDEA